jgi:hypothetical protein
MDIIINIIIIIGFVSFIQSLFRRSNRPTIVLKKFILNPSAVDNNIITIVGRKSGLGSWLFTIIGLYPETHLIITEKDIRFRSQSLFGESNILMTLKGGVSHIRCGYAKPFITLLFAIITLCMFLFSQSVNYYGDEMLRHVRNDSDGVGGIGGVILLGISIVLFLMYYFNKSIAITIFPQGGGSFGVKFKPSLIENVDININKAREVIELMNTLIINAQS